MPSLFMLKYKQFQKEDFARMAMTNGCIGGLDRGLGKSLGIYTVPALKTGFRKDVKGLHPLAPIGIIAPPGLHDQLSDEGEAHFKVRPKRLYTREQFYQLSTLNPQLGKRELPPGFYITSFNDLATNGVKPFPDCSGTAAELMDRLHLTEREAEEWFNDRAQIYHQQYGTLQCSADSSLPEIRAQWFRLRKAHKDEAVRAELDAAWHVLENLAVSHRHPVYSDLSEEQKLAVRQDLCRHRYLTYKENVAEGRWYPWGKVKCVYSPSLADECQDAFAAISVDESVKMKGEDTYVGIGTRQMNPRHRYAFTGTPIKNRLPDIFRLIWWVTGGREDAHGRFPYGDSSEDRGDFSREFLISERNISKEEETNRRYVKLTPQVCNIHRVWKIFSPVVLRRRKEDCGEEIVPKIMHVVRVPMGQYQAAVYAYHLKAKYRDVNKKPAVGARLSALRIVAANPASSLLERPAGDKTDGPHFSPYSYTPKVAAQLRLILDALKRREQIMLASAFLDALDTVSARLDEAGVPHLVLDGRMSPAKRGRLAKEFKKGPGASHYPVLLAGEECMAEGYSFDLANNCVRSSYTWAYDKGAQIVDRVHRITSRKLVNVFGVLCEGSIDRKVEGLGQEKSDACDLVLDGKLFGENPSEVNLAELLQIAAEEFRRNDRVIDEVELEKEWPALRSELAAAARVWASPENVIPLPTLDASLPSTLDPRPSTQDDSAFADLPLWQLA